MKRLRACGSGQTNRGGDVGVCYKLPGQREVHKVFRQPEKASCSLAHEELESW